MTTKITLLYDEENTWDEARKAIRNGQDFDLVLSGYKANIFKQTKRLGSSFREKETPKLRIWEKPLLTIYGLLITSFWGLYHSAANHGMRASWAESNGSVVVSFRMIRG